MISKLGASGAVLIAVLCATGAAAQQDIPWKQTLNIPKGQNMPRGVTADILGIETGDSFEEAKSKLQKLWAESVHKPEAKKDLVRAIEDKFDREISGAAPGPGIQETRMRFNLQSPGSSQVVAANFVSELKLVRELKGTTSRNIQDTIRVRFSAPSSGHQVIGVKRFIQYMAESDQPLVSELMDSLKKKFGAAPQPSFFGLVLQFHQGQVYVPAKKATWHCREAWDVRVASEVPKINPDGDCDVGLRVEIQKGISANHAKTVSFSLSDNERAKANFAADFAYFSSYVQELRGATRGAQPKL